MCNMSECVRNREIQQQLKHINLNRFSFYIKKLERDEYITTHTYLNKYLFAKIVWWDQKLMK